MVGFLRALSLLGAGVAAGILLRSLEAAAAPHAHVVGLTTLALLVIGYGFVAASDPPRHPIVSSPTTCVEIAALLAIAAVSAVVRLHGAESFPAGLFVDEEHMALAARHAIAEPARLLPWRTFAIKPGWVELQAPYYAWPTLVLGLCGTTLSSIKAVSLVPGIATPCALYLLVRAVAEPPAALAAGLLMAGSSWHGAVSRWGWIEVASTLALTVTFLCVARRRVVAAALLVGVDLYLYEALRPAVPVVLVLLLARGGRAPADRRRLMAAAALLVVLVAPLAAAHARQPATLLTRAREVSLARDARDLGIVRAVAKSATRYALMFHQTSDPNPRLHAPGTPLLDVVAGALLLLGAAAIGGSAIGGDRAPLLLLGTGLATAMLPAAATRLADAPHSFRAGAAAPFAFAVAGYGAAWLATRSRLVAVGAVLLSITISTDLLWHRWPAMVGPEAPCGAEARLVAARLGRTAADAGASVWVSPRLRGATWDLLTRFVPASELTPAARVLGEPELLGELSCRQAMLVRDRFGRPLVFDGEGCAARPASNPIGADVWHGARRPGGPDERLDVARFDASACGAAPCFVRFRTVLTSAVAGAYDFEVFADDGAALLVDGALVVRNRGESLGRRRGGTVELRAGRHHLELTYLFVRGEPRLEVLWREPGRQWEPIPPAALSTAGGAGS